MKIKLDNRNYQHFNSQKSTPTNLSYLPENKFATVNGIKYKLSKRYIAFNFLYDCLFKSDENIPNLDNWTKCEIVNDAKS